MQFALILCWFNPSFTCFLLLVFDRFDPNFIAASLDEAYLDITDICKERGVSGEEVSADFSDCPIKSLFYFLILLNILFYRALLILLLKVGDPFDINYFCISHSFWRSLKNSEQMLMKRLVLHVVLESRRIAYLLRWYMLFSDYDCNVKRSAVFCIIICTYSIYCSKHIRDRQILNSGRVVSCIYYHVSLLFLVAGITITFRVFR